MKKIYCLVLALSFIFCGCESNKVNKANIEIKDGYIIDFNIEDKDKSFIFYENKEDNILSVNMDTVPDNIDFYTLDIYIDRYKINVSKNQDNKYQLNSMKAIETPKKENVTNEELDFNRVVGQRLFPDTPEAKFIMKICDPHYYFNKINYDNGEYLPDKKINSTMCLEYFMWLNDWNDNVYLTPQKMGKYYPSEYDTYSFIKNAKEFFPALENNAFDDLPLESDYSEYDYSVEQYLFYDNENNIIKPKMCGLGGVTLDPYLRSFDYIDENTLKLVLMDKSFQKSENIPADEWEYIFTLKDDDTWEFQKIDYLQNN